MSSPKIDKIDELIKLTVPPYKTRAGLWHNRQLFQDQWVTLEEKVRVIEPIFTLYKEHPKYISARKTFVELGDPTGYKWAMKYLGDYEHWIYLMKSPWFREAYETWMNELNQKQLSEAIEVIKDIALSGDSKSALPAARYLAEQGWKKPTAGRPSKQTIAAELQRAMRQKTEEDDDADRIGLKVVPIKSVLQRS